jgi:thioredoxin-like negative regulator of GroEL
MLRFDHMKAQLATQPAATAAAKTAAGKFWALTVIALLGSAAGLASLWPVSLAAARSQSVQLAADASRANGGEASTDYLLAVKLNPHNQTAYAGLARLQIATGHPDDALVSLAHAGTGSDVEQLKLRTLLELGRFDAAASAAGDLTTPGRSEADLLLAAEAYMLSGQPSQTTALAPRLSSPDAARRLARIQAANITFATELYANGLLKSSSAVLAKLPASYDSHLLQARINLAQNASPAETISHLAAANTLNPSNTAARTLLAQIYRSQNQPALATAQDALIHQLQTGRP